MNLEEIVNPKFGLQQDEWTITYPTFGKDSQLKVIGWSGYYRYSTSKLYVLSCSKCKDDTELFGEGVFKSKKGHLLNGKMPCGCTVTSWTEGQYSTLCRRKAKELGYGFIGFLKDWSGKSTRVKMNCEAHGEWVGGSTQMLVNKGLTCPSCSRAEQKQAYINLVADGGNYIAIKFGITIDTSLRVKQQNNKSVYEVSNHSVYMFKSAGGCRLAENICKETLVCGILSKQEMPDGYTETTWLYNLDKIIEVYEANGGVLVDSRFSTLVGEFQ